MHCRRRRSGFGRLQHPCLPWRLRRDVGGVGRMQQQLRWWWRANASVQRDCFSSGWWYILHRYLRSRGWRRRQSCLQHRRLSERLHCNVDQLGKLHWYVWECNSQSHVLRRHFSRQWRHLRSQPLGRRISVVRHRAMPSRLCRCLGCVVDLLADLRWWRTNTIVPRLRRCGSWRSCMRDAKHDHGHS